jgi:hypothetical protein
MDAMKSRGNIVLLLSLTLIMLVLGFSTVHAQTFLPATHDTFIDPNDPSFNYNPGGSPGTGRLDVGYSNFFGFDPSQRSMVRFDVSSVTATTGRSLVVFDLVVNSLIGSEAMDLSLYKLADDTWDESTVTFANAPTGATTWPLPATDLLQTMTINSGYTGPVTFGSISVDNPVGAYIEQERLGDGEASFLLVFDGGTNLEFAGLITFEDSENTGGSGNTPYIDVRTPTAINLNYFQAGDVNIAIWVMLGLVVLISGVTLIIVRQKRTAV